MLTARPIEAFRIGRRMVVVCEIASENPTEFLGKEFSVHDEGHQVGRITIDGVSTASPIAGGVFDFSYSGDEIRMEQLGGSARISEVAHVRTVERIDAV